MSMMDTIRARHSVRNYDGRAPEGEALQKLEAAVRECAQASGLNIQLVSDNPEAFQMVARFGLIHDCVTNVALISANGTADDEAIGYWGQKIVLAAQEAGLNSCWVAMSARKKNKAKLAPGEKIRVVIAVGYGTTPGRARRTKPASELASVECAETPAWFETGIEAAQLAPTAMNNQHFHLTLRADGKTVALDTPTGALNVVDKGIVKRNFEEAVNELGADWQWE